MRRAKVNPLAWHVMARGSRRLNLFRDDQDRSAFLSILRFSLKASDCVLMAYALMSNHYHLVVRGEWNQLTVCMRHLNRMYSLYHNEKYGFEGHAFDGPYKAFPEGTLFMLLRAIAYVFLNPVVGGVSDRPEDCQWTGFRSFLGQSGSPLEVQSNWVLDQVSPDRGSAVHTFLQVLERQKAQKVNMDVTRTRVSIHALQFEWLLDEARSRADQFGGEDPVHVALYWGRQIGLATRAMAQVLGVTPIAKLSKLIYSLVRRISRNPELQARLELK